MNVRYSILFYLLAITSFAMTATIPDQWVSKEQHSETITFLSPAASATLGWSTPLLAMVLFVLALLAFRRPVIRWPAFALLLAIFAFPYVMWRSFEWHLGSWHQTRSITDPTGKTYVFCTSSFLQGVDFALAEVETDNPLFKRLRILGESPGESSQYGWASVVRPQNATDEYAQLYLTDDKLLVGIRQENQCYFTYDIVSGKFLGKGALEQLSPFICLNANDELHEPDIRAIRDRIIDGHPNLGGYPRRAALVVAKNHRNPQVKPVAESLIELIDQQPPKP